MESKVRKRCTTQGSTLGVKGLTVNEDFFSYITAGRVVSNFIMQALEGKPLTVSEQGFAQLTVLWAIPGFTLLRYANCSAKRTTNLVLVRTAQALNEGKARSARGTPKYFTSLTRKSEDETGAISDCTFFFFALYNLRGTRRRLQTQIHNGKPRNITKPAEFHFLTIRKNLRNFFALNLTGQLFCIITTDMATRA